MNDQPLLRHTETLLREGGRVATCAHCSQDVPLGKIQKNREQQFCCSGCELAYQLIHDYGLDAYYDMDRTLGTAVGEINDLGDYAELDSPEFVEQFSSMDARGLRRICFGIHGIHCVACVWLIEKLPQMLPGVAEANVNWSTSTIDLFWDPARVHLSAVAQLLRRLGYRVTPIRYGERQFQNTLETRRHLIRLGVAGAAAGNNMLIALGLYLGWFSGMEAGYELLFRYASCFLGLISLFGPGLVFFRSAWQALKAGTPHMDLPIALGLGAGGIGGLINTIRGQGEIYFDSLGMLVFLLLIGRFIQFRQQSRSADAVELLYQLTPRKARKIVNGVPQETHADLLKVNDWVQVLAGELIPVDGIIQSGRTAIDEGILTGESLPQPREVGQQVAAGTLNLEGTIVVAATAVGAQTRVGQLSAMVERAASEKPQIVQWANKIGGIFVTLVFVLAAATVAIWWHLGWLTALDRAIALLIVACPCALAMATPLALAIALGRAAQRGMLIKSGDVLQRLHRPGTIWLDKTGTVTEGRMKLVDWRGPTTLLCQAAAVQEQSDHPIARSMNRAAVRRYLDAVELWSSHGNESACQNWVASDVQQTAKGGISGTVVLDAENGEDPQSVAPAAASSGLKSSVRILIGNRAFLQQAGVACPPEFEAFIEHSINRELSPVLVAVDGEVRGVAAVGDPLRDDSRERIRELQEAGWQVGMLSGDNPAIVRRVADRLGLDPQRVHGGLLPEDKVEFLRRQPAEVTQVMVGDGVNDSAALAIAGVGIAVHGGSEVSMQAASVYLNRPGLTPILALLDLSRRTMNTMRITLTVSLLYNLFAVALAMFGVINPLIAAVLMPFSSLTVVSLSWFRRSFGDEPIAERG